MHLLGVPLSARQAALGVSVAAVAICGEGVPRERRQRSHLHAEALGQSFDPSMVVAVGLALEIVGQAVGTPIVLDLVTGGHQHRPWLAFDRDRKSLLRPMQHRRAV
jgi:hypothetical protein